MQQIIMAGQFFLATSLFSITVLCFCLVVHFWKKSKIDKSVQIQCSSGDSEVILYNCNFADDDSEEDKGAKLREGFNIVEARRLENHEKWLKIKAESEKENAAKDPKDQKLKSVSE